MGTCTSLYLQPPQSNTAYLGGGGGEWGVEGGDAMAFYEIQVVIASSFTTLQLCTGSCHT